MLLKIGLASLVLAAGGCSTTSSAWRESPGRATEARPIHGDARLVLPATVAADQPENLAEYNFESVRRDGALAVGSLDGPLGVGYYQGERVPSLDEVRWIYLSDDPRRVTYYSNWRQSRRRY